MPDAGSARNNPPSKRWRWFTFRLSTLFVAVTIVAIVCCWPRIWREIQFWRFKGFVGKDIQLLSKSQQSVFAGTVATLLGKRYKTGHLWLEPAYENRCVWRVSKNGYEHYVLFQEEELATYPNEAKARLLFIDLNGHCVGETSLQAGNRSLIGAVNLESSRIPGEFVISVTSGYFFPGARNIDPASAKHYVVRQYLAVADDSIELIRVENRDHDYVRNNYEFPNLAYGPEIALQSEDEILGGLADEREVQVLRYLTWLGGEHCDLGPRPSALLLEKLEHSKLFYRIGKDPRLRPLLNKLASHRDPWIAEGAEQALKAIGTKPGD